jgi:hypothetical protein
MPYSIFPKLSLQKCPSHKFERGLKLEAVDPERPGDIYAATVIRLVEHLLWVRLDGTSRTHAHNHVVDVQSHLLFPIGWCQANSYPLLPPKKCLTKRKCLNSGHVE